MPHASSGIKNARRSSTKNNIPKSATSSTSSRKSAKSRTSSKKSVRKNSVRKNSVRKNSVRKNSHLLVPSPAGIISRPGSIKEEEQVGPPSSSTTKPKARIKPTPTSRGNRNLIFLGMAFGLVLTSPLALLVLTPFTSNDFVADFRSISVLQGDCETLEVNSTSGMYTITADNSTQFDVYCDMETTSGGWTVIQRREIGDLSFNRNYSEYKNGFGNLHGDYWLGLKYIHLLTHGRQQQVLVTVTINGNSSKAIYNQVSVNNSTWDYQIFISGYLPSSTLMDGFTRHEATINGRLFSAPQNNQTGPGWICANRFQGGWWYLGRFDCGDTHLNSIFNLTNGGGMSWKEYHVTSSAIMLKSSQLAVVYP